MHFYNKVTWKYKLHALKSSLIRFELKTYQGVKQLWTKWAKFKRYVKVWEEEGFFYFFLLFSLVFHACFLFPQITKKNEKTFFFSHNGVRSWLAYPESLCFQVFSLFLICRDHTRCTAKSIRSWEDKKKNFPSLFLIRRDRTRRMTKSIRSQGGQQSETKTKGYNNNTNKIWEI